MCHLIYTILVCASSQEPIAFEIPLVGKFSSICTNLTFLKVAIKTTKPEGLGRMLDRSYFE